jgi:hypothetical protein
VCQQLAARKLNGRNAIEASARTTIASSWPGLRQEDRMKAWVADAGSPADDGVE